MANDIPGSYHFRAMGTACAIQIYSPSATRNDFLAAVAMAEVERIETKYSRYIDDSTLSTLNRRASRGESVEVDIETASLLDFAFACYMRSDGLFDLTAGVLRRAWNFSSGRLPSQENIDALLPLIGMDKLKWERPRVSFAVPGMELDFGGIGKEYAVDRVAALLAEEGVAYGSIDLGGDLFALGPHPHGKPWRIGLRDPFDSKHVLAEVNLAHGALATSGDYERCISLNGQRYSHILNPRSGWPVRGLASVTVLAPTCMAAGGVTTIAMLRGMGGIHWLANLGIPHFWIDEHGNMGGELPPAYPDPTTQIDF